MLTASEMGKKGGNATKEKHPDHFKNLARKRFAGMTKEEISEYMKKVRAKKSPK